MAATLSDMLVRLGAAHALPSTTRSEILSDVLDQEPAIVLLKLVQAAVAFHAGPVDVKLPRGAWHLHFNVPQLRSETLLTLQAWLLNTAVDWSVTPEETRGLLHLFQGLAYLRSRPPHKAELKLWCPLAMLLIELDHQGELSAEFEELDHADCGCVLTVEVHHFKAYEVFNQDRSFHDRVRDGLRAHLALCPVPVRLEGAALNPVCIQSLPELPIPRLPARTGSWHYFSLIERWWVEENRGAASFMVESPRLTRAEGAEGGVGQAALLELAEHPGRSPRAEAEHFLLRQLLAIPCLPTGQSYAYAVIDGVLSDPMPIALESPGFVVIVADSQLKTDVSSLNLLPQQALENYRQAWLGELDQLRRHLRDGLQSGMDKLGFSPEVRHGIKALFSSLDDDVSVPQ